MKVCIHRGTHEIGGSCVELESQGSRLVLDLGRPLEAGFADDVPLPPITGLATGTDPALLGVIISHPHLDHWGLLPQVHPAVPVYIGEAASRILQEAAFFSPAGARLHPAGYLHDRRPFTVGPFTVTPYLMDHSAFDSYALLVESAGQRLFYTGDLRAHGRKVALFKQLLAKPPPHIDVLLMEGTNIHAAAPAEAPLADETAVEQRCRELFTAAPGLALVVYSAQNIDRLVSLYRAALQADRDFVMDLYTATMAHSTGVKSIPQPGWERVKVYVPLKQRRQVKDAGEFERVEWVRECRIFQKDLLAEPSRWVLSFRASMIPDVATGASLDCSVLIWSLWDGYLAQEERLRDFARRHKLDIIKAHCSGHATVYDLQKLAAALAPRRIVPIHTEAPERYRELFPGVETHQDREWWHV